MEIYSGKIGLGVIKQKRALGDRLVLSEKELQEAAMFRWEHTCKGSANRVLQITLTPNGIADGVEVKCLACGRTKDVSDTDNW